MRMRPFAGYSDGEERPLAGFALLALVYDALFGALLMVLHLRRKQLPERPSLPDLLLLGIATHKLSRLLAKDTVTSFARAPFTRYKGQASESEVDEEPRGSGLQRAIGELVTCPYCLGLWVASALSGGLILQPRLTRFIAGIATVLAFSDLLNRLTDRMQDAGD
jgi:hypothetical protein